MANMIERRAKTYGLTLIDSDKPIEVKITAEDVRKSKKNSPTDCAIARAVKRQYKDVEAVFVFRSTVWLEDESHLTRYGLPPSLQKEVMAFDRGGRFYPGEYNLSPALNPKRNKEQAAGKHPQRKAKAKRKLSRKPKRVVRRVKGIRTTEYD